MDTSYSSYHVYHHYHIHILLFSQYIGLLFILFRYVAAIKDGNLQGITPPVFTIYPAYKPGKHPHSQGFNLLKADKRADAIKALLQIRHNLICSCLHFAAK
jgi:hypothetical protein